MLCTIGTQCLSSILFRRKNKPSRSKVKKCFSPKLDVESYFYQNKAIVVVMLTDSDSSMTTSDQSECDLVDSELVNIGGKLKSFFLEGN